MNILNILGFMIALLYGGHEVETPKATDQIHVDDDNRVCSNDIKSDRWGYNRIKR